MREDNSALAAKVTKTPQTHYLRRPLGFGDYQDEAKRMNLTTPFNLILATQGGGKRASPPLAIRA